MCYREGGEWERGREGKRVWQSGLEKRCSCESDVGGKRKYGEGGVEKRTEGRDKDRLLRHDMLVPSKSGLSC